MNNTKMRQFRELSDETKNKISMAMKGKSKSYTHKENISNGLKDYWKKIPNKPTSERGCLTSLAASFFAKKE